MRKQNEKPLISFILPNYNNQHVLDLFFEKFLENNTYDNYEFIVVDDGSEDDGLDVLNEWKKSGKIKNMQLIAEPHKGIINALNKALSVAKGEFIIRCDGDATIESKSFVEEFLKLYYINPNKIGVITSKVMIDNGNLHAVGRSITTEEGLHDRGKKVKNIQKRKWDWETFVDPYSLNNIINVPAELDSALGVFTFCDRKTALKIGGFDENYPLWIEDDDFYFSFRKFNKKVFYTPFIEICHRFSLRGNRNPSSWKRNKTLKQKMKNLFVRHKTDPDWRPNILRHDYQYWKEKWGFDLLNPSIENIKTKYAESEICWRYNPAMLKEGQEIVKKYLEVKQKELLDEIR